MISWHAPPSAPKETVSSMIFVSIDIARENKRRAGPEKTKGGQDPVTEPGHRARPQSSGAQPFSVARPGQHGQRTTAGQEKHNSRTKEGQKEDMTRPQRRATELRGAASQCGQFFFPRQNPKSKQRPIWQQSPVRQLQHVLVEGRGGDCEHCPPKRTPTDKSPFLLLPCLFLRLTNCLDPSARSLSST